MNDPAPRGREKKNRRQNPVREEVHVLLFMQLSMNIDTTWRFSFLLWKQQVNMRDWDKHGYPTHADSTVTKMSGLNAF